MTKLGIYAPCGWLDRVRLEMIGTVSEIAPGERVTWSTAGRQVFIHRIAPEISEDDDGNLFETQPYRVASYSKISNFEMYPYAVQFHAPMIDSICVLESVRQRDLEHVVSASLEIFNLSRYEPLCVNWPMFTQDDPLMLRFLNPLDRPLPSFTLSFFIEAPKDFAERWIAKEE